MIAIASDLLMQLTADVLRDPRHERCGLLSGQGDTILAAYPVTNVSPQPRANFEMHPSELLGVLTLLDTSGLELMGVYHSHPSWKANLLSAADQQNTAALGEHIHLLFLMSSFSGRAALRFWRVNARETVPVPVLVTRISQRTLGEGGSNTYSKRR